MTVAVLESTDQIEWSGEIQEGEKGFKVGVIYMTGSRHYPKGLWAAAEYVGDSPKVNTYYRRCPNGTPMGVTFGDKMPRPLLEIIYGKCMWALESAEHREYEKAKKAGLIDSENNHGAGI